MAFEDLEIGDRVVFNCDYSGTAKVGDTGIVRAIRAGCDCYDSAALGEDLLIDIQLDKGGDTACFRKRVDKVKDNVRDKPAVVAIDVLDEVKRVSALFGKRRPLTPVMLQLQEELGELSTEVAIATGTKKRAPSEDGVAGEAVDVAIVALDIAMLELGGDIEAIKAIFERKLAKWESYK